MSKTKDEKNTFTGCCQSSSSTTPENSISEDSIEDANAVNNNTMFHSHHIDNDKSMATEQMDGLCFGNMDRNFPKRPAVDVEFQNIRYTVGKFSFRNRKFGELTANDSLFAVRCV